MGRYSAHEVVTVCPPGPYGVLFTNRAGEHTDLADAVVGLNDADSPCTQCADAAGAL